MRCRVRIDSQYPQGESAGKSPDRERGDPRTIARAIRIKAATPATTRADIPKKCAV
jgi:hypothetical protein